MTGHVPAQLDALTAAAESHWPEFRVPSDVFHARLRASGARSSEASSRTTLERLHVADLYLACACELGDKKALQIFCSRFLDRIDRHLNRYDDSSLCDDVRREL